MKEALLFLGAVFLSGCVAVNPLESGSPREHYRPKRSPDTVTDHRASLQQSLAALAPATLDSLPELVKALEELNRSAVEHPGRRRKGNMPLGAEPVEYVPSDEELMASEVGRRIEAVVNAAGPEQVERRLEEAGIDLSWIEYRPIAFYHVDVMGTGRFTYAKEPQVTRIRLRR